MKIEPSNPRYRERVSRALEVLRTANLGGNAEDVFFVIITIMNLQLSSLIFRDGSFFYTQNISKVSYPDYN